LRQWDLIGITDGAAEGSASRLEEPKRLNLDKLFRQVSEPSVFFWTTDASLRLETLAEAAAELLQVSPQSAEGRDLLDVIGAGGESLVILEGHVSALKGETATFHLRGGGQDVMCRVAPIRDMSAKVIGTFCYAASRRRATDDEVDLRPARVATKRAPKRTPTHLEVA
jgi:hypothetical protein